MGLVEIWSGAVVAAERSVATLLDHSARHGLAVWHARGRCLKGVVLIKGGDVASGFTPTLPALDVPLTLECPLDVVSVPSAEKFTLRCGRRRRS